MPLETPAPLLYTQVLPLDAKAHATLALRQKLNLGFARQAHAVPVNMIEFPQVCHHYPIVFSPDDSAAPAAVLGLAENENLFITPDGRWELLGGYMPSYIRRYPFLLAEVTGTDQFTLCIDYNQGILEQGGTQRFFDDKGAPTAMTSNAMEFCKSFHGATLQTREFSTALQASGLLVAREAEIPLPGGRSIRFAGFRVIDETKWAQLPDAKILEWRQKGWLPAIYAALFSGAQWQTLARLYAVRHGAQVA